jgi:hypothetical protein
MIETYAVVAGTLLLAGVIIGFLLVIAVGIHREEADLTFTAPTQDRLAGGVRAITGLTSRTPVMLREVSLQQQRLLP